MEWEAFFFFHLPEEETERAELRLPPCTHFLSVLILLVIGRMRRRLKPRFLQHYLAAIIITNVYGVLFMDQIIHTLPYLTLPMILLGEKLLIATLN